MPGAFAADRLHPSLTPEERIRKGLEGTILPKVEFHEATLDEAIAILRDQIHRHIPRDTNLALRLENHEPAEPNPQNSISSEWDHAKITAEFSKIPISEALRYLTTITSTKVSIRADGVYIVHVNESDPLVTRVLQIPKAFRQYFMASFGSQRSGIQAGRAATALATALEPSPQKLDPAISLRNFLIANGVSLPVKTEVTVDDKFTRLTVHATEEQIEKIKTVFADFLGPEVPKAEDKKPDVRKKLQSIVLPEIVLKDVSLHDAAIILTKLSARCDQPRPHEQLGMHIALEDESDPINRQPDAFTGLPLPSADFPPERKISYSAKNVSLGDALKAIADLAKGYASPRDYEVYFTKEPHPYIVTREYHISPLSLDALAKRSPGRLLDALRDPDQQQKAKNWLEDGGLSPRDHAWKESGIYIVRDNRLIIRNTPEFQEKVEEAVLADWHEYYAAEEAKKKKAR